MIVLDPDAPGLPEGWRLSWAPTGSPDDWFVAKLDSNWMEINSEGIRSYGLIPHSVAQHLIALWAKREK